MKLQDFAKDLMALAGRKKLDDCELMVTMSDMLAAKVTNKEVKLTIEQGVFSAAIRILKGGKVGYLPLSEPDLAACAIGIDLALTDLRASPIDRFALIPDKLPAPDTFDPEITRLLRTRPRSGISPRR